MQLCGVQLCRPEKESASQILVCSSHCILNHRRPQCKNTLGHCYIIYITKLICTPENMKARAQPLCQQWNTTHFFGSVINSYIFN